MVTNSERINLFKYIFNLKLSRKCTRKIGKEERKVGSQAGKHGKNKKGKNGDTYQGKTEFWVCAYCRLYSPCGL